MAISLRRVCDADQQFLFDLYASTRMPEVAGWGWPEAQVSAFLRMQYQAQHAAYSQGYPGADHNLILQDGQPIGRLLVWRSTDEVCLIDVSLLPQARNAGIGSRLIADLMEECRTSGIVLRLHVLVSNTRARALYLQLGFRRVRGDRMYDEMEWAPEIKKG